MAVMEIVLAIVLSNYYLPRHFRKLLEQALLSQYMSPIFWLRAKNIRRLLSREFSQPPAPFPESNRVTTRAIEVSSFFARRKIGRLSFIVVSVDETRPRR